MTQENTKHASDNEGEGNKTADRRYREKTREFVESGGVEDAASQHENLSAEEKEKLRKAEEEGKSHARS